MANEAPTCIQCWEKHYGGEGGCKYCWKCGAAGHKSWNCNPCGYCGGQGHTANKCPHKR